MSYRTTAVLLVLLALAGGYMYFFTPKVETPEIETNTDLSVIYINPATIRSLEVKRGDSLVSIKRNSQGSWDLAAPQQAEGDEPRIANVIESIASLYASQVLTTGISNLAVFGLDKPDTQVIIGVGSTDFIQLDIGSPSFNADSYYVKRSGNDNIFLIDAYTMNLLKTLIFPLPIAQPTPTPEPSTFPTVIPGR